MGIVIINGKRYDSVTGLMITDNVTDDFADTATCTNSSPAWLNSFVDEPTTSFNATNTAVNVTQAQTSSMVATKRTAAVPARRTTAESRTLNRRFVKKPLNEAGNYAESIAVQRIKQNNPANKAVRGASVPETTGFVPILTKRQAESLQRLSNQQQLSKQAPQANPATRLGNINDIKQPIMPATDNSRYSDQAMDNRLEQLSQILQNVQDIDREQSRQSKPTRTSRRAERAAARAAKAEVRAERRRFRAPAIFATAEAVATIAAVSVYMLMPSISVKMAASKAGIDAKNPYIPSGYSIDGEVAYSQGSVTINYRSHSGGEGYSITQESSNLSDSALRRQTSNRNDGYYQEIKAGDTTAYSYRDVVTWVKDGIQYTIDSNDYLDSDQIDSIIRSI
ncbi:MAG: DUF4367 domain-containing protein [Candidatus Saccharibacteria bacterium]|nr:DUF4367 domain-containing protein [Candidatus Saccharibacteria bacterium]